jgi:CO/xanthine dehydrogenase Mo-binding subunit
MDYLVTVGEIPGFVLEHLETPSPTTWNGVKGGARAVQSVPPSAVAHAASNALAVELNELLLTPERLREAAAQKAPEDAP